MIGPPPSLAEASSTSRGRGGREDAIETLIDIDRHGASFRFANTMSTAPNAALRGRANRITDAALLDAAHALGKHEIRPEDLAGLTPDLYGIKKATKSAASISTTPESSEVSATSEVLAEATAATPPADADISGKTKSSVIAATSVRVRAKIAAFKETEKDVSLMTSKQNKSGMMRSRILRHHDKIVRAGMYASVGMTGGSAPSSSMVPAAVDATDDRVAPPPELIASLRRIFGTTDSEENQCNEVDEGEDIGGQGGGSEIESCVLPMLMHTVLNHRVFAGTSSSSASSSTSSSKLSSLEAKFANVNIDEGWRRRRATPSSIRTLLENLPPTNVPEVVSGDHDDDNDDVNSNSHLVTAPSRVATLESVVGNACRDAMSGSGVATNDRVHGLLIAALSVITTRLLTRDESEGMESDGPTAAHGTGASASIATLDSTEDADPMAPLLQVGALLSALPMSDDDEKLMEGFVIAEKLLHYFADAASTYEERVEIQKANLVRSQSKVHVSAATLTTPEAGKPPPSSSVILLLENDVEGGDEATGIAGDDGGDSSPSMPELIGHTSAETGSSPETSESENERSDGEDPGRALADEDMEDEAGRLLRHIVSIVGDVEDDDDDDDEDDDDDGMDEDESNDNDSSSESDHDLEEDSNEEASDDDHQDDDDREHDEEHEDNYNEEEDEDLQRALSLSLAADIGGYSNSEESHSDEINSRLINDATNNAMDAITEASADVGGEPMKAGSVDAVDDPPSTSAQPISESMIATSVSKNEDDSLPLPQLPSPPPNCMLPNQDHFARYFEERKDEWKVGSYIDLSAVFEPSALTLFGKLPSSHVLVHLFSAVLALMQDHVDSEALSVEDCVVGSNDVKPAYVTGSSIVSRFLSKQTVSAMKKDDDKEVDLTSSKLATKNAFSPDSTTLSLLIASLHLSYNLRKSALTVLHELLSHSDNNEGEFNTPVDYGVDGDFQDDPADAEIEFAKISAAFGSDTATAASDCLEGKGLKRKAAAAAHDASLRSKTTLKLVGTWRKRVDFFSSCCYMSLRCLRVFTGKYMQHVVAPGSLVPSFSASSEQETEMRDMTVFFAPTKARVALLSMLSNLHSCEESKSILSLMTVLDKFDKHGGGSFSKTFQQDQFLHSKLCSESLCLWGCAIPLLYPDHSARVKLLGSLLVLSQSSTNAASHAEVKIDAGRTTSGRIQPCPMTDNELQCRKLDILCKRLRVSDMLQCFVASPIFISSGPDGDFIKEEGLRPNPLPTISLLRTAILDISRGNRMDASDDLVKFYLALCQKNISNLILWNDLSVSSNDDYDHDISGGGELSVSPGSTSGVVSHWADRGSLHVNPTKFHFDSSKCADSISVASSSGLPAVTANQRATKVWGTVLSTTCFNPKSGIHRWAVKLEKCERGHVFVGVATSRVNLKTYVGGDANGWGLIGTQALWHDRNKLRGDYGSTFRTGAVVVITLDTNVGTLSFGLWKDAQPIYESTTGQLSPQALASPRRGAALGATGGPVFEDWGIAFEGLPLDVKLYPAVGLYQRDDRVTFCTISQSAVTSMTNKSSPSPLSEGDLYFPSSIREKEEGEVLSRVRSWNQALCFDGISFASEILTQAVDLLSANDKLPISADDVLLMKILPCLASSISLIPSCIPTLSTTYAIELLPLVTRCAKLVDKMIPSCDASLGIKLKAGVWAICVDSSTSEDNISKSDQYVVSLEYSKATHSDEADYLLYQGKDQCNRVSIIGTSFGTHLQFVEEWCVAGSLGEGDGLSFEECAQKSSASYVIDARLSLDGQSFEGMRHNVEKGSSERVIGILQQPTSSVKQVSPSEVIEHWVRTESLLCLAVGHLSLILCSQTSLSDIDKDFAENRKAILSLDSILTTSPILSRGKYDRDDNYACSAIDSVRRRCRSSSKYTDIVEQWQHEMCSGLDLPTKASSFIKEANKLEKARIIIDYQSDITVNQNRSLSRLCTGVYKSAQLAIASAILFHTCDLMVDAHTEIALQALQDSDQILETGIREALSCAESGVPLKIVCKDCCLHFSALAQFLCDFSFESNYKSKQSTVDDIKLIFKTIKTSDSLKYIEQTMMINTEKSIMRYLGLRSLHLLLEPESTIQGICVYAAIESALVSLPRLFCCPVTTVSKSDQGLTSYCTAIIPGSTAHSQNIIRTWIHQCCDFIRDLLRANEERDEFCSSSASLLLVLLANNFFVFVISKETIEEILLSLKIILSQCRHRVLYPSKDAKISSVGVLLECHRSQGDINLLQTSVSLLMTACVQSSFGIYDSTILNDLLSQHLVQELGEALSIVVKETKLVRESKDMDAVQSDWITCEGKPGGKLNLNLHSEMDTFSSKGLTYLYGTVFSKQGMMKSDSSATNYLRQLLNILHVGTNSLSFIESVAKRASALFSAFGFQLTNENQDTQDSSWKEDSSPLNGLPLRFSQRILRLLRPILCSMTADTIILNQLFVMAGSVIDNGRVTTDGIHTQDDVLIARSSVSLLRYLYTFSKSWRNEIYEIVSSCGSNHSINPGVLAFFGGLPGILVPGAFVVLEPEVAATSSASVKSRTSGTVAAASLSATSFGSGADEIVTGLCRQQSLSGVISSIDSLSGSCEIIVLREKHLHLFPCVDFHFSRAESSVTIRALRVNTAHVSAADELPLIFDGSKLPFGGFLSSFSNAIHSVSSSIKTFSNGSDKEFNSLGLDVKELMGCCQGIRSATILLSERRVLDTLTTDESSGLQLLLARALLMGSLDIHGLSTLPEKESRFWHLLLVRLDVTSRAKKLDTTSRSSLKTLIDGKIAIDTVSPPVVAQSVSKGYRTPPPFSASFFGGGERSSRGDNDRREEDAAGDDDAGSSATSAAAHLFDAAAAEAAIVQMAELGLPRQWAELALSRVGGTNIEAAVHFCLERGGDMERLLAEESQRRGSSSSSLVSGRRRGFGASRMGSSNLIRQLVEMGFPRHWCVEALTATRNNVDEALTWILTNGDRLSAADEEGHDGDDDVDNDSEEEDEDVNDEEEEEDSVIDSSDQTVEIQPLSAEKAEACEQSTIENDSGWSGICPVRFVSGRSSINPRSLDITGLPSGGFSSVGTKGVLLTSGKWYYEAEIKTAGCLQIGWADSSFVGHCQADRGDGCGDGPSSWAFDGWRRYRWHANATEWGCKWTEGDVVGCLVDLDSMIMSFTLNGKGEEIGMGVAFSGEGFRPCSGVYACVSFNRREKLRLILGGDGTEPFKYPPPDGYRGIGEAIQNAAKERKVLVLEEKALIDPHIMLSAESLDYEDKKYICEFSDGEHGHELFAWQHRYYGSDASVHLGSSRPLLFGGSAILKTRKSIVPTKYDDTIEADISVRLGKFLTAERNPKSIEDDSESFNSRIKFLRDAYDKINEEVHEELKGLCASLCVLYSQKLIIHTMISWSNQFSLQYYLPASLETPWSSEDAEWEVSRRLWQVIEFCTSLKSSGWAGEAGAMAMAAEALGLGISTGDNKSNSLPAGTCSISTDIDQVLLACGGLTQYLTSAIFPKATSDNKFTSTNMLFAACSENTIGREMGGTLTFIKFSLQNSVATSKPFRQVLLAAIRRAIRLLSATEYASDEGQDDESDLAPKQASGEGHKSNAPDVRLVSFLTGLFLSKPVSDELSESENIAVRCELFEGWCIGLLSASCPFRMVCSYTAAGVLNACPQALAYSLRRTFIVANYLGGLESKVVRRSWAERAAVPVISKYFQSQVELLASVKRSLRLCSDVSLPIISIKVDSATPLPFPTLASRPNFDGSTEHISWECREGWVLSNTHWEVLTGSVETMEVEWKPPPRSSVRTLMDGGEGPPFLKEGCIVMRGVDWDSNDDDGKSLYEEDKLKKETQKREAEEEEDKQATMDNDAADTESINPANDGDPANDDDDPENDGDPANDVNPANDGDPADDEDPANDEDEVPAGPGVNDPFASPPLGKNKDAKKKVDRKDDKAKKKKKKAAPSKLPLGTVLSIEPWKGIPAMARRIRWHLSGKEGIYRFGGDGGCFDIIHVEPNEKETRVKKKHPYPETNEQCASRSGFGRRRKSNIMLRLRDCASIPGQTNCDGILEWPDYGAGIRVECVFYPDGAVSITEREILYGSKDSGWESRFGQPNYEPGTVMVLSPTHTTTSCDDSLLQYDELLGSTSYHVKNLLNKQTGGGAIRVVSEMRLLRSKLSTVTEAKTSSGEMNPGVKNSRTNTPPLISFASSQPPPICFDSDYHAPSLSLSRDRRSVTCSASDGRGIAFGNVGFTKGVHYWEVKLEKAEIGSIYIGVAEKPGGPTGSPVLSSGIDSQPKLNRWLGWGFVNFRATYSSGAERVFGAHCHSGDTVGVLLDCDAGRINYFVDGVKYGEHILNDLGCAFENISPFGFNADGCGSGGAGQGAPSGTDGGRTGRYPANGSVRPKAYWPVIGLRHPGDRVTISSKWMTSHGVDCDAVVKNILAIDEVLSVYEMPHLSIMPKSISECDFALPQWLIEESFHEYSRWKSGRWRRSDTRGTSPCKLSSYGLDVDLDMSPFSCAAACASIGLSIALLPGDRVDIKRSAGRVLELQEEAVVLGTYQGRLFYRLVSQKSEGGSLMEGGGRSWFWDESEAVEGGLQLIGLGLGLGVSLPKLSRFKPICGGLKVVYIGGAVVRSDIEIIDGTSKSIGTIACGTIILPEEIVERRVNSCGVVRYLIDNGSVGRGWISSRIRGGKEEPIVEMLPFVIEEEDGIRISSDQPQYLTPEESARDWFIHYTEAVGSSMIENEMSGINELMDIASCQEFGELLATGIIDGLSELESDSILATTYERIADSMTNSAAGSCPFVDCALVLEKLHASKEDKPSQPSNSINPMAYEVAMKSLGMIDRLPSTKALMARFAMLRSFNRRAQYAMPWLPMRSAQEGSAILGGLCGFGTSPERAGRTWDLKSQSLWAQTPSISSRLRNCREILFTSTKRKFLDSVMDATTTPTPLSHDEYELPREVRTVRVNRLRARRAMSSEDDTSIMRKHSVFSQLQKEMRGWSGASLRRGFIAKGHGGQKRAFKVKLVGEGVNDYSGPYREVFTDAIKEATHLNSSGCSALGLLMPSANNQADVGDSRDLFIFADPANIDSSTSLEMCLPDSLSSEELDLFYSFSSLTHKKDETLREVEEALSYLGKLVGTGCRHGIPVDLPLSLGLVWKQLTEEAVDITDIAKEIDVLALRDTQPFNKVLASQRRLLNSFTEGLSCVMPVELLSMFTGNELRDIICGNPDIDVELLRKVVEYEGYNDEDKVINNFWEVLREMTTSERKVFLQFVWARNRLPLRESDFDAPFKIQKDTKPVNKDSGDYPLPSASTCFFSLTLPDYPEKELLRQKLLYAIQHVTTMESDYITNDAEVGEGWRGI